MKVTFVNGDTQKFDSLTPSQEGVFFAVRGKEKIRYNATEIKDVRLSIGHVFEVDIRLMTSKEHIKGYLYKVDEDALVISKDASPMENPSIVALNERIKIENIRSINVHRVGGLAKGYRKGTRTGIIIGALPGIIYAVSASAGTGDVDLGLFGLFAITGMSGAMGSIVGLIVGSSGKTFVVNGSSERFNDIRSILKTGTVTVLEY